MQKLSLSVLLHFLRKYSHWNLVRQSQCYHLYFIAKEDKSHRIKPRKKRRKDVKSPVKTSVTCNKIRSSTKSSKKKDILIFNQISKDVQDRVSMGHEVGSNVTTLTSRRSSFSSFIWDDYLPSYKLESDDYQVKEISTRICKEERNFITFPIFCQFCYLSVKTISTILLIYLDLSLFERKYDLKMPLFFLKLWVLEFISLFIIYTFLLYPG